MGLGNSVDVQFAGRDCWPGIITGIVADPAGAMIPGATIEAKAAKLGSRLFLWITQTPTKYGQTIAICEKIGCFNLA